MLAGLPDGPTRQHQELDLQSALVSALTAAKGLSAAEVNETRARARALAEQLDRPEDVTLLMADQWAFHFVRAELRLALALGEQLEQIGDARNDVGLQLRGRFQQGASRFFLGEFVAARALLERCTGLADLVYRTFGGLPYDLCTLMLTHLALTLVCLGYIDQARSRMDEALSRVRRLRHVHTLAHVLGHANWLDWLTGSPIAHAEESLALPTEHGFPYYLGWALAFRGRSLIVLGQAEEGLAVITQGLAELRATSGVISTPMPLTWLAEAYAMLGQPAEARNRLAEAAQFVDITDERFLESELLHRVPGDLLNAAGDQSGAEQRYRRAIAVAERQSAKLFQLRASVSLARLWRDQGKRAEVRDLLGPIYNWFTEGFDAPDLKDAKALLDELT